MLEPRLKGAPADRAFMVRLKLPGGAERETRAVVETSHIHGPGGPRDVFALVRLPDLTPDDVPAGTEVWLLGTDETAG